MRALYLAFGVFAYAFFFATFLYLIAFVGDLPGVPRTVSAGGESAPVLTAMLVNLALVALFGLQHTVMARQGFKRAWKQIVPEPIERSIYVLLASAMLWVLFLLWRPMPAEVWRVDNAVGAALLWMLFGAGWLIVLVSTFLISHFELFGLKQVWMHLRGQATVTPVLRQPFFYRFVRHPLYAGFFLAFWATPVMTAGHLLFAAGMSVYMLIAIRFEERDLLDLFGEDYERYRASVGMLTPRFTRA
ncbi:isoprenylcysteine carboxylmethyltransferase family protein [Sphingomonas sp. ID1715]|uniref:methanethiol S-methyltransferase n=1 Tax=Sphingomonas sp. ID1715 TaxID=1656898 RepID=UPI001488D5BF|nr:methanethiol S-methyltransferase [Sphingomonas sp. ID1715]NNM77370.1 isoprenylcysteine carboxylmethyltransferase family protein [Sphingomonas sp. ID1715]